MGKLSTERLPGADTHSSGSDAGLFGLLCVFMCQPCPGAWGSCPAKTSGVHGEVSSGVWGMLIHGGLDADAHLRRVSVFAAVAAALQPMERKFQRVQAMQN